MSAKIAAFLNFKGGVGKTANVVNLGACLSHLRKKRVLVVDLDLQCNSTFWLLRRAEFDQFTDGSRQAARVQQTNNQIFQDAIQDTSLFKIKEAIMPGVPRTEEATEIIPLLHLLPGAVDLLAIEFAVRHNAVERFRPGSTGCPGTSCQALRLHPSRLPAEPLPRRPDRRPRRPSHRRPIQSRLPFAFWLPHSLSAPEKTGRHLPSAAPPARSQPSLCNHRQSLHEGRQSIRHRNRRTPPPRRKSAEEIEIEERFTEAQVRDLARAAGLKVTKAAQKKASSPNSSLTPAATTKTPP